MTGAFSSYVERWKSRLLSVMTRYFSLILENNNLENGYTTLSPLSVQCVYVLRHHPKNFPSFVLILFTIRKKWKHTCCTGCSSSGSYSEVNSMNRISGWRNDTTLKLYICRLIYTQLVPIYSDAPYPSLLPSYIRNIFYPISFFALIEIISVSLSLLLLLSSIYPKIPRFNLISVKVFTAVMDPSFRSNLSPHVWHEREKKLK